MEHCYAKEIVEERTLTETEVSTRKDNVEDHEELKEELHICSDVINDEEGQEQHTDRVDQTNPSPTKAMEPETTPVGSGDSRTTAAAAVYVGASHSTSKKLRFYGRGAGTFFA